MSAVTAGYGMLSALNAFIWKFSNIITFLKRYIFKNFHKLLVRSVEFNENSTRV